MDYEISKFEKGDVHNLKELIKLLKKHEAQSEPSFKVDDDAVDRMYDFELVGKNKYIYIVKYNNKIVGFVSFEESNLIDPYVADSIPAVYISALFIKREYRGKGLAQKLMDIVENFAKENGIKFIKLLTFSKNQLARDFYFKSGFEDYESTMIKELK